MTGSQRDSEDDQEQEDEQKDTDSTEGDEAEAKADAAERKRQSQASRIVQLALDPEPESGFERATLFHTPANDAYADCPVNGHLETLRVRARAFELFLRNRFFQRSGVAPSAEVIKTAILQIEAQAIFACECHDVAVRIGECGGAIYLDLGDPDWTVVHIHKNGWEILTSPPPVYFVRPSGMMPLPPPEAGGSLDEAWNHIHIADADRPLIRAWLVSCYQVGRPHAVLALEGLAGSAKTTTARMLRGLIDPREPPTRGMPRSERDLHIHLQREHVLAFDNLSGLSGTLSDALCRVASGTGFGTRRLYTDDEEVVFSGTRPIILTGIESVISRPDLADRALLIMLHEITDSNRKDEDRLWRDFAEAQPRLLGAVLDAVSTALRYLPSVRTPSLPRMADFARFGIASEGATTPEDSAFWRAYQMNRRTAAREAVENDAVADAVVTCIRGDDTHAGWGAFEGRCTELLKDLTLSGCVPDPVCRSKDWPKLPKVLSGRLKRAAPALKKIGIRVTHLGGRDRKIRLEDISPPQRNKQNVRAVRAVRDNK